MRVAITGANGNFGMRLIRNLIDEGEKDIVALVRSELAAQRITDEGLDVDIRVVNYDDANGIRSAVGQCDLVFHLVGIIKESEANPFHLAHEAASQALCEAELGVEQIINLGIIGTSLSSSNACLQSRANAEAILKAGSPCVTSLRVAMVLGEGDYASFALARNARKPIVLAFRAASLEQPVDCQDVIAGLLAAVRLPQESRVLELAGPESLTRAALIKRAGRILGNQPRVISIPLWIGSMLAAAMERLGSNPPVTRAMLGVLDHDDEIDTHDACEVLNISLTPLDETLARVLST